MMNELNAELPRLSDGEILERWKGVLSGLGCGCPICVRDLLDEIAMRYQKHLKEKGEYER